MNKWAVLKREILISETFDNIFSTGSMFQKMHQTLFISTLVLLMHFVNVLI